MPTGGYVSSPAASLHSHRSQIQRANRASQIRDRFQMRTAVK
ncbi:MAG TPA: hypothetical protein V6C78_01080 [Crinalium sp.]